MIRKIFFLLSGIIFFGSCITGLLRDTGKEIRLDKPVCLKWVNS